MDGENILDALRLLRLLHGHAADIGHGVAFVASRGSEIAQDQLEQQHHQQHRRRKNTGDDGDGALVPAGRLVVLRLAAHLAGVLLYSGGHLRRGNGHGRLAVGSGLGQLLPDVIHVHRRVTAEFLQILDHGIRRCIALVGVAVHGLHADQLQRLGDAGVDIPRRQRHGAEVLDGHGHGAVALEGQAACEHLIQHHTGGVDVGAGVDTVAPRLLRGNIVHGAQRLLGQRLPGVGQTRNAEIGHLHAAVPQHHDVLGLDIPVDDAPAVGVAQSAHDLGDEVQRLPPVHAPAALHVLLQGNAVDQLHDDIFPVRVGGHVVDRHDVGVAQLGDRLGFVVEPAAEVGVVRQIAFQYFDGHKAVQPVAPCLIHVGHAAGADQLQYFVAIVQHFSDVLIHVVISLPRSAAAPP